MINRDVLQARFNKLTKVDDTGELICNEGSYPNKRVRFETKEITLIALSYFLKYNTLPFKIRSTSTNPLSVDPKYLDSIDLISHLNRKGEWKWPTNIMKS